MQLKPIMMKRFYTLISIVLLFAAASAQTVTLTFTGRDANNQTVALDSVVINNLTKGWQETLTTPDDTVLTLQNGTGIDETIANGGFGLSQNNPNPFNGTTAVNLTVTEPGMVTLEITDVNGRIVRTNRVRPEIGTHQFRVTLSTSGTYVMTARQNGKMSSVKMVCNGTGNGNRIEHIGAAVETRHGTSLQTKSRARNLTDNPFDLGDEMEYFGFATINGVTVESQHVTQAQNASETIVLTFAVSQGNTDGMPCPGTPTLTDIDGNVYNTVMIGTQCWMKENLRTTHYPDNTVIPVYDTTNYHDPYRYAPNNVENNVAAYGYLYSWKAVLHGANPSTTNPSGVQGICPNGWHVPSYAEWTQLTDYVKSQSEYVCFCNLCENNYCIAKSLAAATGWIENDTTMGTNYCCTPGTDQAANNATGFSGLPAGVHYRENYTEHCFAFGGQTYFWSSTAYDASRAYQFGFMGSQRSALCNGNLREYAISVRCVRN